MTDSKQEMKDTTTDTASHLQLGSDATHMEPQQQSQGIWTIHPAHLNKHDEKLALKKAFEIEKIIGSGKGLLYCRKNPIDIHIALAGDEGPPLEQLVVPGIMQWDLKLALPLMHISFLLNHLIPRRSITQIYSKWTTQRLQKELIQEAEPESSGMKIKTIGSISEGLNVPGYMLRSQYCQGMSVGSMKDVQTFASDSDNCSIAVEKKVGLVPSDDIKFILDPESTYPGYCRLVVLNPEKMPSDYVTIDRVSKKVFLKNDLVSIEMVKKMPKEKDPDENAIFHGPAVTIELKKTMGTKKLDSDHVLAFPCVQWPKNAKHWFSRATKSGCPSKDLKYRLISKGCLVVPVAHKNSEWPEVEWRISFARAEKTLVHTLGDIHRQCAILLKVLLKHVLEPSDTLTSYHIKTLIFWTCEGYPMSVCQDKEEGLAVCLLLLLDELLNAIASQHLPHYFIQENNLFSQIHPDFLSYVGTKVSWLRCNLLQAVFSFDKMYVFTYYPRRETLEWVFQPLVDDALKPYQSIKRAYRTYIQTLQRLAVIDSKSLNADHMIDSCREICQIKKIVFDEDIDFIPLALSFSFKLRIMHFILATYERLMSRFPSHKSMVTVKSDLAGYYHSCYYDKRFSSEKEEMLQRAIVLYKEAIGDKAAKAPTWTDYANFCIKESLTHTAMEAAQNAIGLAQTEDSGGNSYAEFVKFTVPGDIQQDIEKDKTFQVRSESYARYLLVLSYIQVEDRKHAEELMEEFQNVISTMPSTSTALPADWKLVGYGWKALEKYGEAKHAFNEVLELQPGSEAALEAKLLCEAMLMSIGT